MNSVSDFRHFCGEIIVTSWSYIVCHKLFNNHLKFTHFYVTWSHPATTLGLGCCQPACNMNSIKDFVVTFATVDFRVCSWHSSVCVEKWNTTQNLTPFDCSEEVWTKWGTQLCLFFCSNMCTLVWYFLHIYSVTTTILKLNLAAWTDLIKQLQICITDGWNYSDFLKTTNEKVLNRKSHSGQCVVLQVYWNRPENL